MIVYTGGTFDLFHAGHVNFLKQCYHLLESNVVIVSLNTDEFIEKYKGKPPVYSYEDRKAILESCRYVYRVEKNEGGADSKPAIRKVNPTIIAIGTDWACRDYYKQMDFTQEWLDEKGIQLVYLPYTERISSTKIKERIKNETGS